MTDYLNQTKTPCGCGRSMTGYCTGLHELTEEEYQTKLEEEFKDTEQ